MLLTPEKSIESQNDIGADIMTAFGLLRSRLQASVYLRYQFSRMALDDVATRPVVVEACQTSFVLWQGREAMGPYW